MNLIGTWKVKKVMTFTEDDPVYITHQEFLDSGAEDGDVAQMFATLSEICEDGAMNLYMQLPKEVIAEAKAEGAAVDENGRMLIESYQWTQNGDAVSYMVDDCEAILELDEEGLLQFHQGFLLMEKA